MYLKFIFSRSFFSFSHILHRMNAVYKSQVLYLANGTVCKSRQQRKKKIYLLSNKKKVLVVIFEMIIFIQVLLASSIPVYVSFTFISVIVNFYLLFFYFHTSPHHTQIQFKFSFCNHIPQNMLNFVFECKMYSMAWERMGMGERGRQVIESRLKEQKYENRKRIAKES